MLIRDTYTEAKVVSSGSSTSYIDLAGGYDNLIVASTLTGAVTAYMIDESNITDTTDSSAGSIGLTGVVLPALTAGTYRLHIRALKCATGADAAKIVVAR